MLICFSFITNLQCNVRTCDRLASDTKVLDIHVTSRENVLIDVSNVDDKETGHEKGILIDVPRTNASMSGLKVSTTLSFFAMGNMFFFASSCFRRPLCLTPPPMAMSGICHT